MDLSPFHLLHQMLFGAIAAAGFGVLFNIQTDSLAWCLAGGGLALFIRTIGTALGCSLEASSFAAALAVGFGVRLIQKRTGISRTALASAGCIPMVPGSFAAKAILGLISLTEAHINNPTGVLVDSTIYALRVFFTIGAIGTGLAIPAIWTKPRPNPVR